MSLYGFYGRLLLVRVARWLDSDWHYFSAQAVYAVFLVWCVALVDNDLLEADRSRFMIFTAENVIFVIPHLCVFETSTFEDCALLTKWLLFTLA